MSPYVAGSDRATTPVWKLVGYSVSEDWALEVSPIGCSPQRGDGGTEGIAREGTASVHLVFSACGPVECLLGFGKHGLEPGERTWKREHRLNTINVWENEQDGNWVVSIARKSPTKALSSLFTIGSQLGKLAFNRISTLRNPPALLLLAVATLPAPSIAPWHLSVRPHSSLHNSRSLAGKSASRSVPAFRSDRDVETCHLA
jgi:hypothetical protein